jgi:hypothetical protein
LVQPLAEGAAAAALEVERLQTHLAGLKSRVSAVPSRCIQWGAQLDLTRPIGLYDGKLTLPKGSADKVVAELRQRLAELRVERDRIATAPYPAAFCKTIVRQWVEDLAGKGAIDVRPTIARGHPPMWSTAVIPLPVAVASSFPLPDMPATVAWLFKDVLIDRLCAEIDALAKDDRQALTTEQRRERDRAIGDEILLTESTEEAAIETLEKAGSELPRRDDCDPRAVLNLSSALPPP